MCESRHIRRAYVVGLVSASVLSLGACEDDTTKPEDTTAPATITDFAVSNPTESSVVLTWTAPGDDISAGTASAYDIRYSTDEVTDQNWGSAVQVAGEPTPKPAGQAENFTVTDLDPRTEYFFGIKTADEVPNWSGTSNSPRMSTAVRWDDNGHLYLAVLVPEGVTWTEANAAAPTFGGGWHLATITSAEENAFVYDLVDDDSGFWNCCLSNNSAGPWLGGFHVGPRLGDYEWVTGEPFIYTNWGPREPFGNGDRIGFFGYQTFMGPVWNDVPTDRSEYGYVIECPGC